MTDAQRYELWQYSVVAVINPQMNIVRNNASGQLMVLRLYNREMYPVLQMLCQIKDRNLMQVYDAADDGKHCLGLCEFIEGITLEQLVKTEGVLSEKRTREIAADVCAGLSALHRRGIIHKDIKPSNVMVDKNGVVKIIDYDIVRIHKNGADKDTRMFGTAGYASPEHFGFGQTDPRSDIYSVGVLMNYLLTGAMPAERRYFGPLSPVIQRCLEVDANKRYDSVELLYAALWGDLSAADTTTRRERKKRPFRPLPGFRGKNVFVKILMTILLAAYFLLLFLSIQMAVKEASSADRFFWEHLYFSVNILVFFTGLPYIFFGDVFYLSEKIYPSNPARGRQLTKVLGVLSIAAAIAMMFLYQYMPFH